MTMTMQDFIKLTDEQHEELDFKAEQLTRKRMMREFILASQDEQDAIDHADTMKEFSF
ncbi:hypothetical protein [Citrobacter freundii]|uniref:hypothetical protein n=1 Tax=Citrobacter freundii TaxID=546 RepID=UPI0024C0F2FB|nr:hypothetical protein [Citrobacter freundii]WHW90830.1 hypothetical protein P0S03_16205 [Citrobacter freundii]